MRERQKENTQPPILMVYWGPYKLNQHKRQHHNNKSKKKKKVEKPILEHKVCISSIRKRRRATRFSLEAASSMNIKSKKVFCGRKINLVAMGHWIWTRCPLYLCVQSTLLVSGVIMQFSVFYLKKKQRERRWRRKTEKNKIRAFVRRTLWIQHYLVTIERCL